MYLKICIVLFQKRDHAIEEELCSLREQVQYLTSRYQGDSDIGSPRMYSSHVTPGELPLHLHVLSLIITITNLTEIMLDKI